MVRWPGNSTAAAAIDRNPAKSVIQFMRAFFRDLDNEKQGRQTTVALRKGGFGRDRRELRITA
jgi:hypothetical protein